MPSRAYHDWRTTRASSLNELAEGHKLLRGRPIATQQIKRLYAVLLASQFQGFCRDLHTECVDHLVSALTPGSLQQVVQSALTRNRKLDWGNANPGSVGEDFGRLGVGFKFWDQVDAHDAVNPARKKMLEKLNDWRNAIVHEHFDAAKLGGRTSLRLSDVKIWRRACRHLARSFDVVMRAHLQSLTGIPPW
jgi:hypothetical protein